MNIIGISALFHDSACCLIQDGRLVAAVEEERLSRVKHDSSMPVEAFRYCLEAGNLEITNVDAIAFYENPSKKLGRQIWMSLEQVRRHGRVDSSVRLDAGRAEREIRSKLGFAGPIDFFDHHLSHAAGSFFYSGFGDAAIMTFDGVGEWTTTSYGSGRKNEIDLFDEVEFPNSLGLLYSAVTSYLGFSVNDAEYKVMGLAPYGKPKFKTEIYRLIDSKPGGGYCLNLEYFDFIAGSRMYSQKLVELFGQPARISESAVSQFHKDVAHSLQSVLEEVLIEKACHLHSVVQSDNLCLSGGVALNCVANGKILRSSPFKNLFVQPAAGDSGSALGAAALSYIRRSGERPRTKAGQGRRATSSQRKLIAPLRHVYLGPKSTDDDVLDFLSSAGISPLDFTKNPDGLIEHVAKRLEEQDVIGWFQGRCEFGPRALGSRSILADPRNTDMRDRINAFVKKREAFRPFAPSVLETESSRHFDLDHDSRFMLETCQVTSPLNLPAITHVDGSARVQTVSAELSPRYAKLIGEFGRRTGCPILLNTSFNLRGEPIVQSPFDAFWCFVRSDINCLVMENYVVDRSQITEFWLHRRLQDEQGSGAKPSDYGIAHNVYTFF